MQYIEQFLKHLNDTIRLSQSRINGYYYVLKRFKNYFNNNLIFEESRITVEDFVKYFRYLEKNISNQNYSNSVSCLKRYFDYLEQEQIIFLSPLKRFDIPKQKRRSYKTYNEKYIKNLLDNIDTTNKHDFRTRAMLELAYSSALRPREIYNLKLNDIDFKKRIIFIHQSKNKKDRIVPVGKTALYWIQKYINEIRPDCDREKSNNYLFLSIVPVGKKLNCRSFRAAIQRTLAKNKLDNVVPYSFRSSSSTHLLLNGMSILHIQKLLGHEHIHTTQRYLKITALNLKNELSTKHPRNKIK